MEGEIKEGIRRRHDGDIKGMKVTGGECAGSEPLRGPGWDILRIKSAVEEWRISEALM